MAKINTEQLRIWGNLQGVGFSAFVKNLAEEMQLTGQLQNLGGMVEILVCGSLKQITAFVARIREEQPKRAEVVHIRRIPISPMTFEGFTVLGKGAEERPKTFIPADISVCQDCLDEMNDKENRRYKYAYINCRNCGPGYSVLHKMPRIRENTSMNVFSMCEDCKLEFKTPTNNRYHSATVSCHCCGPKAQYVLNGDHDSEKSFFQKAAALLKEGRVIAMKGMTGYELVANPFDDYAVQALRRIKNNPLRPFAMMFLDLETLQKYVKVNEIEAAMLQSYARPVVQLEYQPNEDLERLHPAMYEAFSKGKYMGMMLPNTGEQYRLLEKYGGPLLFTSANRVGMPPIIEDDEMKAMLREEPEIAEMFYHEREIVVGVEVSVGRVIDRQPQLLRRSRGYVPVPLTMNGTSGEILAVGTDYDNDFSISQGEYVYCSQFIGNLISDERKETYRFNVDRLLKMLKVQPKKIVCDMDFGSFTSEFAKNFAEENDIPLLKVQHHHAHIASVMAENNLKDAVIGVCFDGHGYGTDGALWGGEFMLCAGHSYQRLAHLKYMNVESGADSLAMNVTGMTAAKSCLDTFSENPDFAEDEFAVDLSNIFEYADMFQTLEDFEMNGAVAETDSEKLIQSSAVSDLFLAVATLLGFERKGHWWMEAVEVLEDAAYRYIHEEDFSEENKLAYDFHLALTDTVCYQCLKIREKTGCEKVVLSGAVFQDRLLLEGCIEELRKLGFRTYVNSCVGLNDGGISYGQSYLAALDLSELTASGKNR